MGIPIFRAQVKVYGEEGYVGNGLTFSTASEAKDYAIDLSLRWTRVESWRVVSDAPDGVRVVEVMA